MGEHKEEIRTLSEELDLYKQTNEEQKKELEEKSQSILKTQSDMKDMNAVINKLQQAAEERKGQMAALNDLMFKEQGDSIGKLKYNKKSQKQVVFVNKINQLFYYDAWKDGKSDQQKYIVIKDVKDYDNTITKGMTMPWFLVIGEKRCALFGADTKDVKDKWVKFIKESLGKGKSDEDDQKGDE